MDSIEQARADIRDTDLGHVDSDLRLKNVLLQFFKDRAVEIISKLDEQGLMLDEQIKIGGTN
jgi:hypothetical protein